MGGPPPSGTPSASDPEELGAFGACTTDFDPTAQALTHACNDDGTDPSAPRVTVAIRLGAPAGDRGASTDVNGLAAIDLGDAGCDGCPPTRFIPALDLELHIDGSSAALVDGIWTTVTASGGWRAEHLPAPAVPEDWVDVEYEGLTASVPPDWAVVQLDDGEPTPTRCWIQSPFDNAAVVTGVDLVTEGPDCPTQEWLGLQPAADGVNVVPGRDVPDPPLGWPLTTAAAAPPRASRPT